MRKIFLVLNVFVLLVLVLGIIFLVWKVSFKEEEKYVSKKENCVDVHRIASFYYDVCYENVTKNILVEVKRGFDIYKLNKISFNFFDYSNKTFEVDDVPYINSTKAYKIYSERNPKNLYIKLDVFKDFSSPVCDEPRIVFVRDCPYRIQENIVNVSMIPFKEIPLKNYTKIGPNFRESKDFFSPSLIDKDRYWRFYCESNWKCSDWGECINGIQKRDCVDLNNCSIPTMIPDTNKLCKDVCVEDWVCEWSECRNGFTVPTCKDLNNCGTTYNMPKKLSCFDKKNCYPEIYCEPWSECLVEYNFLDIVSKEIKELKGYTKRKCYDNRSCIDSYEEKKECSLSVDVYARSFFKCGVEYVGIYNKLDNKLLARVSKDYGKNPYLNINFNENEESFYCDYCFNGVLDGDETQIDCGGSCISCEVRYPKTNYKKKNYLDRFMSAIFRFFG